MTVTLTKGGNLLLVAEAPTIAAVRIGLGWQVESGGSPVELDGVVSVLADGTPGPRLVLAHQVPNPEEAPSAGGTPDASPVGDAEKLVVTLAAVPGAVSRLVFGAVIYDAVRRRQGFRSVRGAYIRVLDDANGIEIARYSLDRVTGSETAMVFGELYRNPRGWKFRAVGQGYAEGLRGVAGGTGDPASLRPGEVTGYLRRSSTARTRRNLADHLHPSGPIAPAAPAAPARPGPAPPAPARPDPAGRPAPAAHPAPAARPAAPPPPPGPAPTTRPAAPVSRSSLDLGGGDPSPAVAPTRPGAPAPPVYRRGPEPPPTDRTGPPIGEHSSRHRQRTEHVAVLDDDHPATTWTPADQGSGGMTLTLRWDPLKTSSGLPRPSDLHLAVLWQSVDRAEGALQTMDNTISAPGTAGPRQVLRLGRRDEREGQTLFVDLATVVSFRRFFVVVYGQHGSPEWSALRPVLTAVAPSGEQLTIPAGEAPPSARLCLLASFHVAEGDLMIRREDDFAEGGLADLAPRYGWDLTWNPDGMTVRRPR